MKDLPQDLRTQTLAVINAHQPQGANAQVGALIGAWLNALDDDDLAGTAPDSLATVLLAGFAQAATRSAPGCQIAQLRYSDGAAACPPRC